MAITRYSPRETVSVSPWNELGRVSNRLSRLFDDRWPSLANDRTGWFPAVNLEEMADEFVLTAELPGMDHDNVDLELENNVLTITGERMDDREEKADRRYHLWERTYGRFQRSFTLPRSVDPGNIDARFENGVLYVHMPKLEEAKGRRIQITRGS